MPRNYTSKQRDAFAKVKATCFSRVLLLSSKFDDVWSCDDKELLRLYADQLQNLKEEKANGI